MFSLEQVADRLGLHVRTVRNYVRTGRLNAVRIGKQYRVSREALEAITGQTRRHPHVEASSVIQIDAVGQETATRVANSLLAAAKAGHDNAPLKVETIYDEERARMKIIVIAGLPATAEVFKLLAAVLEL
jgi:excisionase family DNA binding protein